MLLKNKFGVKKEVPTGFSWTTFFFGFFVPLFRENTKWAVIMFISTIIVGSFTFGFGALILNLVFAANYNQWYIDHLKENGYEVVFKQS